MNAKSWASFGWASLTTVIRATLVFTNVQVTVCPGGMSMFETGLPLLQDALVWNQPLTGASEIE